MLVASIAALLAFVSAGAADDGTNPAQPPVSASQRSSGQNPSWLVTPQYAHTLEKLPNWNGAWDMPVEPGKSHAAALMFDQDHVYIPPDPAGKNGGFDFGPLPGSYDTAAPYKPQYWKQYMEIVAKNAKGMLSDPVGNCMQPHGMPREMSAIPVGPYIVVTPSLVLMHWSWLGATRYIFTDGRGHPPPDELMQSYMGHSVGHWEGGTLVVDTVGMYAGQYDQSGAQHSDKIHVLERIRLIGPDTLRDDMTVEDPIMLRHPWRITRNYTRNKTERVNFQDGYCPPSGNTIDYSAGFQNEVLPMEQDQKGQRSH